MTAQTSIEQRQAQPTIHEAHSAPLATTESTTESVTQRGEEHLAQDGAAMPKKRGRKLQIPSAQRDTPSTAILVCGAILVISALFAAGFMRPQLERALERLFHAVENMDVPVMLPVYIGEAVQELLVDRHMIAKKS